MNRLNEENTNPGRTLEELYELWDQLGDIPVVTSEGGSEVLDAPFLHFEAGTPREDVWHWFEDQHLDFIVGDVQQGFRRSVVP